MVGIGLPITISLTACGGGGSSTDTPGVTPSTALIAPGAYIGSVGGKEWVSILLPTSATATNFYALHYNGTDPDIYSGSGQITGTNSATLSRVYLYPDNSKPVRTGTGTLSSLGNGAVRAALSFAAAGTEIGKDISIDHSAPTGYAYNTAATLASVQGTWQGRWSYGLGFADNMSLNVSAQGAVTSSMLFQNDCQLSQSNLAPNYDGSNLFTWTLSVPAATVCSTSFGGQTLTGSAFISPSPVAGKTQRLYLVGVTTDGRGISFKADR